MSLPAGVGAHDDSAPYLRRRAVPLLGAVVYVSLLVLIVLTAIPYGTAEVWWKAFFVCAVFGLAIIWLVEGALSESWITDGWFLVTPILALAGFCFLQTLAFAGSAVQPGVITQVPWIAVSADPYQTRFFIAQLLALLLVGIFLIRYSSSERRLRILINVVIGVVVASAIFGILRQTTQHRLGFVLPLLPVESGYGQFINKNHFAFLMEMGFGLTIGTILGGLNKREQSLIYVAALLPIWTGLVLCGSRGGLIAMLAQVIATVLLFGTAHPRDQSINSSARISRLVQSWSVRMVLLVVLVGGVVLGTLWLGGDRLATRIEESRAEFGAEVDASRQGASRNEIWRLTWRMFAAHPFLGVGMGAYWVVVPTFHDAAGTTTPREAHNDYLELLASGGLVGSAIALWFALAVFRRIRQNLQAANRFRRAACFGATVSIVGVAVHSLLDFGLHMMVNALVFTTLIVIATSNPGASPKTYE